jgi:soluble lytic murein transglycosylase-like protein
LLRSKLLTVTCLGVVVPSANTLIAPASETRQDAAHRSLFAGEIQAEVLDAAREHNVDPAMIFSVMAAESSMARNAVSPKGAIGLMQVMPETARELGYDPSKWQENIRAGTVYLGMLLARYRHMKNGVQLALAAYNAGPTAVARYKGIPPYRETRKYVRRVLDHYYSRRLPVLRRSSQTTQATTTD